MREGVLYIDFSKHIPNGKEVSNKIRELGGKVFIAHLYTYPLENYEEYLDSLRRENVIDGVEVYYSKFTDEQIKFLEKYCDKHNLLMSGGSDCHGDKRPEREVGTGYGNMMIPEKVIEEWIEDLDVF